MKLSVTVILGLAGSTLSRRHAAATARLINKIRPRFLSALTLMLGPNEERYARAIAPDFSFNTPLDTCEELGALIRDLDVDRCIYCRYCIDVAPRDCIKLVKEVQTNEVGAVVGLVETNSWKEVNAVVIDNARCIHCGECVRVCPVDCISVSKVELVERLLQSEKK